MIRSRLSWLREWFGWPAGIHSLAELESYLGNQGAYIAQASAYSYCRARTGFMAPKLFHERPFLESLEITRWEALHAVLGDLFLIGEGLLRPHMPREKLPMQQALTGSYQRALNAHGVPPHRKEGWEPVVREFERRLQTAQLAPPLLPDHIAAHSGKVIYEHLPFHEDMLKFDEEMVVNSVRFRVLRFWEELNRRLDAQAIAEDLTAHA